MELTKQDKKHIKEQVRKLSFRIIDEAKEYAENAINYTFIAYTRDILGMKN